MTERGWRTRASGETKLRNEAMRNKEDAYLLLLQLRVQGLWERRVTFLVSFTEELSSTERLVSVRKQENIHRGGWWYRGCFWWFTSGSIGHREGTPGRGEGWDTGWWERRKRSQRLIAISTETYIRNPKRYHYFFLLLSHRKEWNSAFATTWMDVECIVFSEISQTEKDNYCMSSLMWKVRNKTNEWL